MPLKRIKKKKVKTPVTSEALPEIQEVREQSATLEAQKEKPKKLKKTKSLRRVTRKEKSASEETSSPEKLESGSVSEETINVDSDPLFQGMPESEWRDMSVAEVQDLEIPELKGCTLDQNQKYLLCRMLASSKPFTMKQMHAILEDVDPSLDYPARHFKINQLRLEQTIRLMSNKIGGEYVFEPRRS